MSTQIKYLNIGRCDLRGCHLSKFRVHWLLEYWFRKAIETSQCDIFPSEILFTKWNIFALLIFIYAWKCKRSNCLFGGNTLISQIIEQFSARHNACKLLFPACFNTHTFEFQASVVVSFVYDNTASAGWQMWVKCF